MPGFKEGELILSSTPYAYVLNDEDRGQFCDYCFKDNDELKRCSQCSYLFYCDKFCQKKAWEMHKLECKFLAEAGRSKPPALTRLTALVFLKVKKYGYDEPSEKVGDRKVSMASLMSHAEKIKQLRMNNLISLLDFLKIYIGKENVPPLDESAEIWGKINTNVFAISHLTGPDGVGLFLGPSVFDHSCDPEAVYLFDGTTLNIRMRRSVPHREIKQIHITYLSDLLLSEERNKKLWETKFFRCTCSICTSPTTDYLMTKLVSDTPETKKKALKCKKDLENLLSNGPDLTELQLRYDACKRLLVEQSGVLADTNVYKVKTLDAALTCCLRLGSSKWNDAIEIFSSLEEPYRMYFGTNHPRIGYFLYQYGRTLCYLERYAEAMSKLSEAETIVKVTHGDQHPILATVNYFVELCRNA